MYREIIKERFPHDEKAGLFKSPRLPAVRLGKILRKDTRISSPNDVLALHIFDGVFNKGKLVLTEDRCFHEEGSFLLEDMKEVQVKGDKMTVFVNQKGQFLPHEITVKNAQVAKSLQKVLTDIAFFDPKADKMVEDAYKGKDYNAEEIKWLKLRDEVMRTIDLLYTRYNDGKLSMMEYENKKTDLLSRL